MDHGPYLFLYNGTVPSQCQKQKHKSQFSEDNRHSPCGGQKESQNHFSKESLKLKVNHTTVIY